jgi:hypothetical protein
MPPSRFDHDQLTDKALAALREAAQQVHDRGGPIEPSAALRFALAFLANGHDDRTYIAFWRAVTRPAGAMEGLAHRQSAQHFGRLQSMNNACRFIHRLHGREPG